MTAKEMFESLGWKQTEKEESEIGYERGFRSIYFMKWDEQTNVVASSGHINMKVLKAINKQCEELGWLDD